MLKDLVWKEDDRKFKLLMLKENFARELFSETGVNIDNVPLHKVMDTIKELINQYDAAEQEILNKPIEYTKQDIIDMFVEAGLYWNGEDSLTVSEYTIKHVCIRIESESLYFLILINGNRFETNWIKFNDRKTITFYYNIFKNILEFETNKEKK